MQFLDQNQILDGYRICTLKPQGFFYIKKAHFWADEIDLSYSNIFLSKKGEASLGR